jgi:hypothetical protein
MAPPPLLTDDRVGRPFGDGPVGHLWVVPCQLSYAVRGGIP